MSEKLKPCGYFSLNDDYDYIDHDNGTISFGAYSYKIDSTGHGELTTEETKQFFLSLRNHYIAAGDAFWRPNDD